MSKEKKLRITINTNIRSATDENNWNLFSHKAQINHQTKSTNYIQLKPVRYFSVTIIQILTEGFVELFIEIGSAGKG